MQTRPGRHACGTCGEVIRIPLAKFGKAMNCPSCGDLFRAPQLVAPRKTKRRSMSLLNLATLWVVITPSLWLPASVAMLVIFIASILTVGLCAGVVRLILGL